MIIVETRGVVGDLTAFARHRLRSFCDPGFTLEHLIRLHQLPPRHSKNASNQAAQVRYCLLQAQEYFESAEVASLATRPLLLYYAIMSLALAEVLVKGTGNVRLPKLRENHNSHGLSLASDGPIDYKTSARVCAERLRAVQQFRGAGNPFGTFEVWRTLVREPPLCVKTEQVHSFSGGTTSGFKTMFIGQDTAPPLPAAGTYSLLDAVAALPQLQDVLGPMGIPPACARTTITARTNDQTNDGTLQFIAQPAPAELLDALSNQLLLKPEAVNSLIIRELPSCIAFDATIKAGRLEFDCSFPPVIRLDSKSAFFVTNGWKIGEFGAFYVALHIAGNLVRYFPDIWMPHVERSTALALLVREVCDSAVIRLPVLTAGELDRRYYFQDS